jgi:hypothetical protein
MYTLELQQDFKKIIQKHFWGNMYVINMNLIILTLNLQKINQKKARSWIPIRKNFADPTGSSTLIDTNERGA